MFEQRHACAAVSPRGAKLERELRLGPRAGLENHETVLCEDGWKVTGQGRLHFLVAVVRRVDQDEIVLPARRCFGCERTQRIALEHCCASQTELVEVSLDHVSG